MRRMSMAKYEGPLSEAEQWIVDQAHLPAFKAAVEDGLRRGHGKYGAFDPKTDDRNLLSEAMEEVLDAFVYLTAAIFQRAKRLNRFNMIALGAFVGTVELLWTQMHRELEDSKTLVRVMEEEKADATRGD